MAGGNAKGGNKTGDDILRNDGNLSILRGGKGNDTYFIDTDGVLIDEKNNGGVDHVITTVDYSLGDHVENLTLAGTEELSGTSNDLDNFLEGNAASNTLSGGGGNDTIAGGGGSNLIDGGDGTDTVYFVGDAADHQLEWFESELWVTSPTGEVSVLSNVERLAFDDQVLDLSLLEVPAEAPQTPLQTNDDFATIAEDNAITLHVLENDNGLGLSIFEVTDGTLGTVTVNPDNTLRYVPHSNASGTDRFSYRVIDQSGQVSSAEITVEIEAVNDAPTTTIDIYATAFGETLVSEESVLGNDVDPENDILTVIAYDETSQGGGTVSMAPDGMFTFQPADGYSGTDSFSYTVADGNGGEQTGWVQVAIDDSPVAEPATDVPAHIIDGLIHSATERLNYGEEIGTPTTVTYAFATTPPDYYPSDSFVHNQFQEFTDAQKLAAEGIFSHIESFCGLNFVEAASVEDADIVLGSAYTGTDGFGFYPDGQDANDASADIWLNPHLSGQSFEQGSYGYYLLMHEIGHSVGLSHPEYTPEEDTQQFTVMSAFQHATMYGDPSTFMAYDIAAMQHLYGVNAEATAGDDVYTAEEFSEQIHTIWDAGGVDTLDMSASEIGVQIDLRDGSFSTVTATGEDNVGIAYGTVIENAIGSGHDDQLLGNESDNTLTGGEGSDSFGFDTDWGHDVITDFMKGQDVIDFSKAGLSYGDLELLYLADGVQISAGDHSLFLSGQEEELDEADFAF